MKASEFNLGQLVSFKDTVYINGCLSKETEITVQGKIKSISVITSVPVVAYGVVVETVAIPGDKYYKEPRLIDFIIKSERFKNYIGEDIEKLRID